MTPRATRRGRSRSLAARGSLNRLDARGVSSVEHRAANVTAIKTLAKRARQLYLPSTQSMNVLQASLVARCKHEHRGVLHVCALTTRGRCE